MKAKDAHGHSDQENQSPDATSHDSCQGAVLQLVPPTPHGTAPMRAAAMSVAAKGSQAGVWAAPLPVEGAPCFKPNVHAHYGNCDQTSLWSPQHELAPAATQVGT